MPISTAGHTSSGGDSPSSGNDRTATQSGNILVSVNTSETGSRVSAKNVHTRLMLPAMLRSHNVPGRHSTSRARPASASSAAMTSTNPARTRATTCQS